MFPPPSAASSDRRDLPIENRRTASLNTTVRYLKEAVPGEITVMRSRFIATLCPVNTEEEALAFIERTKKQYWDARHNCSAFVIGDNAELTRCSDDGEPPHTAGRPMLDALLASGVRNVCVVVTRYFGGILLGTGGLVRAYREAVGEGLKNSVLADKMTGVPLTVTTDYTGIGKILYLVGNASFPVIETEYAEEVTISFLVPPESVDSVLTDIANATAGKAVIRTEDPVSYSLSNGNVEYL